MDKDYSFDLRTKKVSGGISVTQDVNSHLEWAKYMRENTKTGAQFRKRADTGYKPFCNIPDTVALDIATNSASNFIARFTNAGNNVNRLGIFVQTGINDGSGTNSFFEAYTGGGASTGILRTVDGVFQLADTSDRRLKQDIVDTAVNGITSVNAMKVRDFAYKTNPTVTVEAGFIAQELQEVFSPSVSYSESDSDRILSVSRERLVPVLVKAIQEQNALIVALTARVTTLEG